MINVMIIGAGQLGSRHLQGAMQSKLSMDIVIVDPSLESLENTKARAAEVKCGHPDTHVSYIQKIFFDDTIDVCIIATTANVRFSVLQELVEKTKVRNIIFEKVLFQKELEYFEVERILNRNQIGAWVNCPRRVFPTYQIIRDLLSTETNIQMSLNGSNWGLACNGIHFLDIFSFITGICDFELDNSHLKSNVIESKRAGFYEVFGTLSGSDSGGNSFVFSCEEDSDVIIEIRIVTKNYDIFISEIQNKVQISHQNKLTEYSYQSLYQSQLTHLNIEEIVSRGCSSLTSYSESKQIHIPFIRAIKNHIEKSMDKTFDACPIT